MKDLMCSILVLILLGFVSGCGKGQETTTHPGGTHVEAKEEPNKVEPKKADELDELKELTMGSIQKEGKMQEVAPGTVQISSERQQLIGVKIGTVEMKPLEKVVRTVGRVDYDEKRIVTVSPKIGGWIEDLYVDFTGRYVRQGDPLLTIYSPELVSTQEEYLLALSGEEELEQESLP